MISGLSGFDLLMGLLAAGVVALTIYLVFAARRLRAIEREQGVTATPAPALVAALRAAIEGLEPPRPQVKPADEPKP
jgi:hypothetical protein